MKIPDSLRYTGKDPSIKGSRREELLRVILNRLRISKKSSLLKESMSGFSPSVFVGTYGYPNVRTGFMVAEEYDYNDDPLHWSKNPNDYKIPEILGKRTSLINSNSVIFVKSIQKSTQFNESLKEVALGISPADIEAKFENKPKFSLAINRDVLPHGPSAELKKIRVQSNPKIPLVVQKFESDTDLKASSAVNKLFEKGFDEHYLTKILSSGSLGVKKQRKIVPTRWSITAIDDVLGKDLSGVRINDRKEGEFEAYFGGYLGNYYLFLIFPGPFRFELYETYVGSGLTTPNQYSFATDYEGVYGRKNYAQETAGGYYASRLAVLEYLKKNNITGSVLALRFITDEYWVPLGVWVVREASRKSLSSKPLRFDEDFRMLKFAKNMILKHFNLDLDLIYKQSKLLIEFKQSSLKSFF